MMDLLQNSEPAEPAPASTGDLLFRLSQESGQEEDQTETKSQAAPEDTVAPEGEEDWVSQLSTWEPSSEDTSSHKEEESLTNFLGKEPPLAREENEPVRPEEVSFTGWLREQAAESSPQEDELHPWLNETESSKAVTGESGETIQPEGTTGEESLPEWFASFNQTDFGGQDETSQPVEDEASLGESSGGDLPDWLRSEEQPSASEADGLPAAAEPPVSEMPEQWAEAALPAEEELPGVEDLFASERPDQAVEVGATAAEAEELPEDLDWPAEPEAVDEAPSEPQVEVPAGETPEWLRNFGEDSGPSDAVPPLLESEEGETLPEGEETSGGFTSVDLPDWLAEEKSETESENEDESELVKASEPVNEEIAQAELPEWVKEMRPIEAVIPGEQALAETSQQAEKAGPLAGLRGVLPAEEQITRYRKPPVYSAKLRVSEKQRSQSSLLDSIVNQESQPMLISPKRSRAPKVIARILVAVLLVAVLTGLRFFPLGLEPAPMLTPPELLDMLNQIDQAGPQTGPVLLAVDYEPGRSREMYFSSAPVIEHLMAKNARIVVLSTVPTGPALAQKLLTDASSDLEAKTGQTYDSTVQTINLGYLPGGTISLLEFAQLPFRAAPASLEGDFNIWNQSFLSNVRELDDFSQVIVLTDSAETGRAWVEQVQPLMGETPLFMVASAQAFPLLMPYVQSQQVNGMVSGLLGGVMYGQWRQTATPAGEYWETYQIGILLAVAIILIGGLFSGVVALMKRKDREEA